MWTDAHVMFKFFLLARACSLRPAPPPPPPPPPPRPRPHQLLIQPISQAALFSAKLRSALNCVNLEQIPVLPIAAAAAAAAAS